MNHSMTKNRIVTIDGVTSVRELGGLPTNNNRRIKEKRLLRSSSLHEISDRGIRTLKEEYCLSRIYDLRSQIEINELPDRKIEGVEHIHLEMMAADTSGDPGKLNVPVGNYKEWPLPVSAEPMYQNYRKYASGKEAIDSYRRFFADLQKTDGCILFHCRSGKDRTGILALLIEQLLQTNQSDIHEDYLLVNQINKKAIDLYVDDARIRGAGPFQLELMKMSGGTDMRLLEQFYDEINTRYGGIDRYLEEVIGISKTDRKKLIDKYTEKNEPGAS